MHAYTKIRYKMFIIKIQLFQEPLQEETINQPATKLSVHNKFSTFKKSQLQ